MIYREYQLWYLFVPLIGAAIGWITNYLAVKMLFHPRKKISFFGIGIQGVFPKRQKALAHKIGRIVSEELFSVQELQEKLRQKAESPELLQKVTQKIEIVITQKLPQIIPMLAAFINPEIAKLVTTLFLDDMKHLINEMVDEMLEHVEAEMDIHEMVEEKVAHFSSDKLEEILFAIMKKEFRFIELIGAVLGFLIGLVQLLIVFAL